MCSSTSRLFNLLHLSMCLVLRQYHVVLMTTALYILKLGSIISPAVFFLIKMVLAIQIFVVPYEF